jgi:hypothetical protein
MRSLSYRTVTVLALTIISCGKEEGNRKGVSVVIPPGSCVREAECQTMADSENAHQKKLRHHLITQGLHEQYLPCGKYIATKDASGYFWNVTINVQGCPATAGQPDPHPDTFRPADFCTSKAVCQPVADELNAYQDELREKLIAQGVHKQYLPCGKYKPTKAPKGYWSVRINSAGCPATASKPDPNPNVAKAPKIRPLGRAND